MVRLQCSKSSRSGINLLFNMQNKLMDVHQSDISKIPLFSTSNLVSYLHLISPFHVDLSRSPPLNKSHLLLPFLLLISTCQQQREHTFCFFEVRLFVALLLHSVMLELWGMQNTPSLPLLPGPLRPKGVALNTVLSMDQIELFDI